MNTKTLVLEPNSDVHPFKRYSCAQREPDLKGVNSVVLEL